MPNLLSGTGMLMDTAEKILNNNGFKNLQWVPVDNLAPYGTVLSQSVTANTEIDVNTLIVLEYSTGKAPEPTNPSEPGIPEQKEIEYSFVLPSVAESYTLRIETDGQVILAETTIQPGQTEWTMVLTGSGIQVYTLYVNSEIYETVTVDFESYE
jgi:beta-lactam-binding protein with PASTA domain